MTAAAIAAALFTAIFAFAFATAGGAAVSLSNSGWSWANPTPQGRTLRAVSFAEGTGYAVGDGGTVLATTDAGATWSGLTTGTTRDLESEQVLSSSTVVVSGGGGCVLRLSSDGGKTFKSVFNVAESSCPEPVSGYSFVSAQSGFLLLKNGAVEATADGGETFSRRTGIPGTSAGTGGGTLTGSALHFASATSGIAFVRDAGGNTSEYATPDGGVSWTQVALPAGANVVAVRFIDANTAYAIGPATLLRSTDGGQKWESEPIAAGKQLSSIDCAGPLACIFTLVGGKTLLLTKDGGATASEVAASSSAIDGAAYASPSQIVAVGSEGATVLSHDGGEIFQPLSADIGGEYLRVRRGPGSLLVAPGNDGNIALSTNGGQSWRVIATQSSATILDAAFATSEVGYALDSHGGLQQTKNAGASWQTLSPGTNAAAQAVATSGESVLLIGPVGVHRANGGGRFEPVTGKAVKHARLDDYDQAGSALLAFGAGTHTLILTTDDGASWKAIKLPLTNHKGVTHVAIRSIAFVSARRGYLLDTSGRLWSTANAGRKWAQVLSTGTGAGIQVAFADATNGYLTLQSFGADSQNAYVLHTSDGGRSWQPQVITRGMTLPDGIVATGADEAAMLVAERWLFTTTVGGEVLGESGSLGVRLGRHKLTRRALKQGHGTVTINGTLGGAVGGEKIVVSRRSLSGGGWQHRTVVAGANGGSFTSTWNVTRSSVFVAQWAGDSGRPGRATSVLKVVVPKA
jgi:photosystem II stability/assembly factor-like uncharacterized protein